MERERICDGYPDCVDHADELNCQPEPEEGADRCPEDECSDGTCIYSVQRCDGRADCPRGDDEHGCRKFIKQYNNYVDISTTFCLHILKLKIYSISLLTLCTSL